MAYRHPARSVRVTPAGLRRARSCLALTSRGNRLGAMRPEEGAFERFAPRREGGGPRRRPPNGECGLSFEKRPQGVGLQPAGDRPRIQHSDWPGHRRGGADRARGACPLGAGGACHTRLRGRPTGTRAAGRARAHDHRRGASTVAASASRTGFSRHSRRDHAPSTRRDARRLRPGNTGGLGGSIGLAGSK